MLDAVERMHAHLTAAVVSNDPLFLQARFDQSISVQSQIFLKSNDTLNIITSLQLWIKKFLKLAIICFRVDLIQTNAPHEHFI